MFHIWRILEGEGFIIEVHVNCVNCELRIPLFVAANIFRFFRFVTFWIWKITVGGLCSPTISVRSTGLPLETVYVYSVCNRSRSIQGESCTHKKSSWRLFVSNSTATHYTFVASLAKSGRILLWKSVVKDFLDQLLEIHNILSKLIFNFKIPPFIYLYLKSQMV